MCVREETAFLHQGIMPTLQAITKGTHSFYSLFVNRCFNMELSPTTACYIIKQLLIWTSLYTCVTMTLADIYHR